MQSHQLHLKCVRLGHQQWKRRRNGQVYWQRYYTVFSAWDWVSWCCLLVYLVAIVDFIQCCLSRNTHRDVLPSLLRELGSTHSELLRFSSQQTQSEALQKVVKKCRMTWFHFARCLLRSHSARPFIFEIAKWTGGESCGWVLCRPGCIVLCLFRLSSLQSLFLISSRVCWEETLAVIGLSWPLRWEYEEHLLMKSKECLM